MGTGPDAWTPVNGFDFIGVCWTLIANPHGRQAAWARARTRGRLSTALSSLGFVGLSLLIPTGGRGHGHGPGRVDAGQRRPHGHQQDQPPPGAPRSRPRARPPCHLELLGLLSCVRRPSVALRMPSRARRDRCRRGGRMSESDGNVLLAGAHSRQSAATIGGAVCGGKQKAASLTESRGPHTVAGPAGAGWAGVGCRRRRWLGRFYSLYWMGSGAVAWGGLGGYPLIVYFKIHSTCIFFIKIHSRNRELCCRYNGPSSTVFYVTPQGN